MAVEAAKRAPMMYPYWYTLARRFGREAQRQLDPAEVERLLGLARTASVEGILDAAASRSVTPRAVRSS